MIPLRSPAFERPIQNSARYVKQFRYLNRESPEEGEEDEYDARDAW